MAIDFSRSRDSSGSEPAPWGPVRSGSAAGCVGLRCLFLVVIVRRPGPDANFFLVLRKRLLNLRGRFRTADQTLAFQTLDPPRERHSRPSRLRRVCHQSVHSAMQFRRALSGTAHTPGFPGDALDEADILEVTLAFAECGDCGGLKYSPRRNDL